MKVLKLAVTAAVLSLAIPAMAYEAGDMIVRVGAITVDPQDNSSGVNLNGTPITGSGVEANADTELGITFTYMFDAHWGLELLAASPFKHTLKGTGGTLASLGLGDIADVKQLPPTLSAQYYFNGAKDKFQPYVGLGVNYTTFFDEKASNEYETVFGPSNVTLDDSWGLAAQVGFDYQVEQNFRLNVGVWYMDIDTDATIKSPGTIVKTTANLDPLVYMFGLAYAF